MRRSEIVARVEELLEDIVHEAGVSLVDVDFVRESGHDFLRVYIDRAGGVRMEDCETVSRSLGSRLDELDFIPGSYILEVSSPGAERVLKKEREFRHFAGRRIDVTLFAPTEFGKKFTGTLLGIQDGIVSIQLEGGRVVSVPREKIARAGLVLEPEGGRRR